MTSPRGKERQEFPQKVRKAALPDSELIRERLFYCPKTGIFTWRTSFSPKSTIGTVAGRIDRKGYRVIKIGQRAYKAHRLAWAYMTGADPALSDVDHRNGNRSDNRWNNLRLATNGQNVANSKLRRDNKARFKGVTRITGSSAWQARIRQNGQLIYIGSFPTPEEAHAAYLRTAHRLFGEFANGGSQ